MLNFDNPGEPFQLRISYDLVKYFSRVATHFWPQELLLEVPKFEALESFKIRILDMRTYTTDKFSHPRIVFVLLHYIPE